MKTYEKYLNEAGADANKAYQKRYNSILKILDKLKQKLKKHSAKQSKNLMDWGYAGDLEYIDDELAELIKNFN